MVEKSRFFDTKLVNGVKDRVYPASDYADYFAALVTTGVFGDQLNALQVVGHGTQLQTIIKLGKALLKGYYYENTDDLTLSHDVETVGNNRIDRIVLRLNTDADDPAGRSIKAVVVKGNPGASPVAPELTRTTTIYEVSLAQVPIVGGQGYIGVTDPVDERGDNNLCGYVKYQAKPAWYPQGQVPGDVWMYLNFKTLLTAQEIADIEANTTLMDMIKQATLLSRHRSEFTASTDFERSQRDFTDVVLELYYTGQLSGPAVSGASAITLDGFINKTYVDDNSTAPTFAASGGGEVMATADFIAGNVGSARSLTGHGAYLSISNIANVTDLSTSTASSVISSNMSYPLVNGVFLDAKVAKTVRKIWLDYKFLNSDNSPRISVYGSNTNSSTLSDWTLLGYASYVDLTRRQTEITVASPASFRYYMVAYDTPTGNTSGSQVNVLEIHEAVLLESTSDTYLYGTGKLLTTEKTLSFNYIECRLFATLTKVTGAAISVEVSTDGGATYQSMSFVSKRDWPRNTSFEEHEFAITLPTAGNKAKFRFTLTAPNSSTKVAMKTYGAYFIEQVV